MENSSKIFNNVKIKLPAMLLILISLIPIISPESFYLIDNILPTNKGNHNTYLY